jgi:hypothetical protein
VLILSQRGWTRRFPIVGGASPNVEQG